MQNTSTLKPNTNLSSNLHDFTQHRTPHYPPTPILPKQQINAYKIQKMFGN